LKKLFCDYDRQRAWYMDIAGSDQDVLIWVSKVNYKVFKVPIRRGDELFNSGFKKYNELAFKMGIIWLKKSNNTWSTNTSPVNIITELTTIQYFLRSPWAKMRTKQL
jgi:hypothetical protein